MDRVRNERTEWEGLTSHPDPSFAGRKERERLPMVETVPNDRLEA